MKNLIYYLFKYWKAKRKIRKPLVYALNIKSDTEDNRDYVKGIVPFQTLPDKIDYSHFVTVKQQGKIGSCGSHAAATGLEMLDGLNGYKWNMPLSERFHYYMVRQTTFMGTYPLDSGQDGRNAMKVMNKVGICPEQLCQYIELDYNKPPSKLGSSFARWWKVKTYERCIGILSIKSALYEKKAVWLGIPVDTNIVFNRGEVITYTNNDGGHAMCMVGYDDSKKSFRVVNSWGKNWGDKGFGWISYDYLTSAPWYDAWSYVQ